VDDSDVVISFSIRKEVCIELWNSWLKSIWFAPSDFMKNSSPPTEFRAVYMPFWLFEVDLSFSYSCTIGISEKLAGKTEFTMITPAFGTLKKHYPDVLISASDSIESGLLDFVAPWKLDQMQRFTLKHTEDTEVRAFTISAENAWQTAKKHLDQRIHAECEKDLRLGRPIDKIRDLNIETMYIQKRVRRLFLPIYCTSCMYKGKDYTFIINGSSAKVYGQRPYSTGKLASLSFTGIGAALGLLTTARLRA